MFKSDGVRDNLSVLVVDRLCVNFGLAGGETRGNVSYNFGLFNLFFLKI